MNILGDIGNALSTAGKDTIKLGATGVNEVLPGNPATSAINAVAGTHYSSDDPTPGYSAKNVLKTQFGGSGSQPTANQNTNTGSKSSSGSGTTTTVSGSGSGSSAQDYTDTLAYLDNTQDAINRLLQSARTGLQNATTQINNAYNKDLSRENEDYGTAQSGYKTQENQNTQNKLDAYDTIGSNANSDLSSLRSLVGAGGSVAQYLIPYLVSQRASQDRTAQNQTYAQNAEALAAAEAATKKDYDRYVQDLNEQKNSQLQSAASGELQQENNLEDQLGQIAGQRAFLNNGDNYAAIRAAVSPIQSTINSNTSALDNLFSKYQNPTFNVTPVTVATPDLSQYEVDRATINQTNNGGNPNDTNSPYFAYLQKKQQQQNGNGILSY